MLSSAGWVVVGETSTASKTLIDWDRKQGGRREGGPALNSAVEVNDGTNQMTPSSGGPLVSPSYPMSARSP